MLLTEFRFYLDCARFSTSVLFCCKILSRAPHCIWFSCLLKSRLVSNSFSVFLCFGWPWMTFGWSVLRSTSHILCRLSPFRFDFFFLWFWGYGFLRGRPQRWKFCPHHIMSGGEYIHLISFIIRNSSTWLRSCLLNFSTMKLLFFSFPYSYLLDTTH